MGLPVWAESDELRRFVAGYLAVLPIRKNSAAIDRRFIQYVLSLTDGVLAESSTYSDARRQCARTQIEVRCNRSAADCWRAPPATAPKALLSESCARFFELGLSVMLQE
jgi:hypothetical protein